jgi:hypothetical protein
MLLRRCPIRASEQSSDAVVAEIDEATIRATASVGPSR